jgi:hypothetical protein
MCIQRGRKEGDIPTEGNVTGQPAFSLSAPAFSPSAPAFSPNEQAIPSGRLTQCQVLPPPSGNDWDVFVQLLSSRFPPRLPGGWQSPEKKKTNHISSQRAIGRCLAILVAWVQSRRRGCVHGFPAGDRQGCVAWRLVGGVDDP